MKILCETIMVHPKKDEREDIPNKLCGGSMVSIPYSGRHHVEKKTKCYLLCYMFKNECLINLWACVCRSISTCVWGYMHLCTCTEGRRGARGPLSLSLPFPFRQRLPESGAPLFSARLEAKTPQPSCLFLHWSWSDRHARDARLITWSKHAYLLG